MVHHREVPQIFVWGEFEVFTDNNPLTYILTTAELDATGQRWVASLANYNFRLHYKSGKTNMNADALSQIPWNDEIPCSTWEQPVIKAIIYMGTLWQQEFIRTLAD